MSDFLFKKCFLDIVVFCLNYRMRLNHTVVISLLQFDFYNLHEFIFYSIYTKDRLKTGFTFTAENESTAESESSFSAGNETKTKLFCRFLPKTKRKMKLCIFSKTLKNKWLLLIQHPYYITVARSHQSHRITVVIYFTARQLVTVIKVTV